MKTFKYISSVAVILAAPSPYFASAATTDNSMVLQEVSVTARRFEENLQTVPMAVTNITGEDLAERGAVDLRDISSVAPNADITGTSAISGFGSAPVIFLRGMGQEDFQVVNDPAVGVYVDGIYLARTVGSLLALADTERVEVLRGPQGTLFGANAIGGAINFITKKPTSKFTTTTKLTLGDYSRQDLEIVVNGPLMENLAGRLSFLNRSREGFVKATQYPDVYFGDVKFAAYRGQLRFTPTDTLSVDFSADYSDERERPGPHVALSMGDLGLGYGGTQWSLDASAYNLNKGKLALLSSNPTLCGSVTQAQFLAGKPFPNNPACYGPYWVSKNHYETNDVVTDKNGNRVPDNQIRNRLIVSGAGITTSWEIGSGTLKGIFGYRQFSGAWYNDNDLAPMLVLLNNTDSYVWFSRSQELQYAVNLFNNKIHLTTGVYHFDEKAKQQIDVGRARALQATCCGTALEKARADGTFLFQGAPLYVDNESSAAYTQLRWDITPRLHLTEGVRYTHESKDFKVCQEWPGNGEVTCNYGKKYSNENMPMSSIGYDVSDKVFTYVTYSEGYRSGGFPGRVTFYVDPLPNYDPEYAKTTEVGIKSDLFENRLRVNLAAFNNKYVDMQLIGTPLGVSSDAVGSSQENLGDATINGVEIEMVGIVNRYLQLDLTGGMMDAYFNCLVLVDSKYNRIGCSKDQRIKTGDADITMDSPLPRVPAYNFTLGATLEWPLKNGDTVRTRLSWKKTDKFYYFHAPQPIEVNPGYQIINASITYRPMDAPWTLSVGSTNLLNEDYLTSINQSSTLTKASVGEPRFIYVSYSYKFGD